MLLDRASTSGLAVEELCTLEDLEALRPEWEHLWEACSAAVTPFQSSEWCIPWWRELGRGRLWVLAFRAGDHLVGLAPLWVDEAGAERVLFLVGVGNSDYLDVLVEPGFEAEVGARLWDYLEQEQDRWDRCDFQPLRPGSCLHRLNVPAGWSEEMTPLVPCPAVEFTGERIALDAVISPHFRKHLLQDHNRLARVGEVTIERAHPRTLPKLLQTWIRLHSARWRARGEPGALAAESLYCFHLAAAGGLAARGVLRLFALRVNEEVAGCYYGFLHRGCAYYYLGGFDPAFEQYGVGNQLVWHALESAIDEGARTFDFLRGQESYKYRWGAVDRPMFRRTLGLRPRATSAKDGALS